MTMTTSNPNSAVASTGELDRPDWLSPEQWPFTIRRYEHSRADGTPISLHYTDEGAGPVLVFVHAGMWSFVWRDAIAQLRSEFRCISLDFPGAGLSDGSAADIDLATYPTIVEGLLDHCGVNRATFVVHDLGGVVGVLAAAARAEEVTGLVVTNSFAWAPDRRTLKVMLRIMGSRTATLLLGSLRLVPRMTGTKMGVGRHYDEVDRRAFLGPYRRRRFARNFHRAMRSAVRSAAFFDDAGTALRTTLRDVPVLTVFGEKNDPFGFADRWRSMFPDATSWVVAGGNHFPMCDDPHGYVTHVRDWHHDTVAPG